MAFFEVMQIKVLLIEPPFFRFKGANSDIFPVGLGYVASLLDKNGYFARVYNAELFAKNEDSRVATLSALLKNHQDYITGLCDEKHFIWQEVKEYIAKYSPDVVGIAASTPKFKSALKVAELVKKFDPSIKVIVGGLHPTIKPVEVISSEFVDVAVVGEGEVTFLELIRAFEEKKNLNSVNGIFFKSEKGIVVNTTVRALTENLDDLPFPHSNIIVDEQKFLTKYTVLMCSRGCPYSCIFCNSPTIWGKKVRYHSVSSVVGEMKKIWTGEKVRIQLFDDTFTLNKEWVLALCKAIIADGFNPEWSCLTRIDKLDEEMLVWMKKAGCKYISIGVESGSQKVLNAIKKGITLEQIYFAEKLLKKYGVDWGAFFVIGFPFETKEDMLLTLKLMKELSCSQIILSVFTPYPGTIAFEETKKLCNIGDEFDWEKFSHQSPDNCFCPQVSAADFKEIVAEAFRIADKKNTNLLKLLKKAYVKKSFFLTHPKTLFAKVSAVFKVYF